jgi:hypothetical protein
MITEPRYFAKFDAETSDVIVKAATSPYEIPDPPEWREVTTIIGAHIDRDGLARLTRGGVRTFQKSDRKKP